MGGRLVQARAHALPAASALGLCVPLALLPAALLTATWGRIRYDIYPNDDPSLASAGFKGTALASSFQVGVVAATLVLVVLIGSALVRRRSISPLTGCGAVVALAIAGMIGVQLNSVPRPYNADRLGYLAGHYEYSGAGGIAAAIAAFLALLLMAASRLARRRCPDCAEIVLPGQHDCVHCGYKLPVPKDQKRCVQCARPIRAEAKVCKYCAQRQNEDSPTSVQSA